MQNAPSATQSPTQPQTTVETFELKAGPYEPADLHVLTVDGKERISRLFAFHVRVLAEPDAEIVSRLLRSRAYLSILANETLGKRYVHGIVGSVTPEGASNKRLLRPFSIRIVPELWLLKHKATSRIFQNKTIPAIVEEVLKESSIPYQLRLTLHHSVRDYCVQYQESDLAFIKRIMAEEGIFWYFEHGSSPSQRETLILLDSTFGYSTFDADASTSGVQTPTIRLREFDAGGQQDGAGDDVLEFRRRHSVRPTAVLLKDYDFKKPLLNLQANASDGDEATTEDTDDQAATLQVYEHRGDYGEPEVTRRRAKVTLEQHRRTSVIANGESDCRFLLPGHRFRLEAEANAALNREYVVTAIVHIGVSADGASIQDNRVYRNMFECAPADVAFRPKRPKREWKQVLESAVVVGPAGEEVYTDEFGRIKVQFHWDLSGGMNENSSTWLRVVQPWSGASYGAQFVPRVGTEVMVSFLGGDQDCPVVVGCMYNATHPTPFGLPADKTRTGIRTKSSPGGAGYNELSFEDAAGKEQVYLHAQRDLDEHVGHNRSRLVIRDERAEVRGSQTTLIGTDQTERVEGSVDRQVRGSEAVEIRGHRRETTLGTSRHSIGQDLVVRTSGVTNAELTGQTSVTVRDNLVVDTEGSHAALVGRSEAKRSAVQFVEGTMELVSTERTEIVSTKGIRLRCGQSIVEILEDRIDIVSPTLTLRTGEGARLSLAADEAMLHGQGKATVKSAAVTLKGQVASLTLDTNAKLGGSQVQLCTDASVTDPSEEPEVPRTVIELRDDEGNPIPYQRYVLVFADGSERMGFLDKDGKAELDVEEPSVVRFPGLLDAAQG